MTYDYESNFKIGQTLYDYNGYSYKIIKVTSNSITLSNKHVVQMYPDNKLLYQYSDNYSYNYQYKEYYTEANYGSVEKASYLIIAHIWFIDSIKWHKKVVHNFTQYQAKAESALFAEELNTPFEKAAATYFKIDSLK